MSKEVDDRVVSMQFDNKNFESNVNTSLNTLEKLKSSLKLPGVAKGLKNVNAAAKDMDMNPLSRAVETVGMKFNSLQVMATTALVNITNSAVNAGKRIVSAFTIDPVKTGLAEYETQINAVQTILANTSSKGTTLEQVNKALDELNHYADMTIYNFTEMTRNIGTFTAAGVDLDTSVSAIKGIANLAAVSGSTSHQASAAMYQLSQALAAGTVKLMDWNSVVNAGMGGQVFQDALKETARVNGIAIDDMIEKHGSFRETLQEGWLTSEVLTQTLAKFTGDLSEEQLKSMGYTEEQIKEIIKLGKTANDAATKVKTFTQLIDTLKEAAQSGWTQTWEILIGDFEEAKALWTSVSDYFSEVLNKSAESRNNMLQGWADEGGRDSLINSFKNVFQGLLSVIKPFKEAFREIFPKTTSDQLLKITKSIEKITSKLILSEKAQAKLKSTFKGLFSIVEIFATIVKEVIFGVATLAGKIAGLGTGIVEVTGTIGDFLSGLRDSIKQSSFFSTVIQGVVNVLSSLIGKLVTVINFFMQKIAAPGFEWLFALLKGIGKILSWIAEKVSAVISSITSSISNAISNGDASKVIDLINGGVIAAILFTVKDFLKGVTSSLTDVTGIVRNVVEILDSVKNCFEAWQQDLRANTLLKIAGAIGILAASILILSTIDSGQLSNSLGAITVLFANLIGAFAIFNKLGGVSFKAAAASASLIIMSSAILILALALKTISSIDQDKLLGAVVAITALSGILIATSKLMGKSANSFKRTAKSLISMSVAILILAAACRILSGINADELKQGLLAIAAMIAGIIVFLNLIPKNIEKTGFKLISLASALFIMSLSLKIMGSMDMDAIKRGLLALGASMLILAVGLNAVKGTAGGSAALMLAAVALGMLVLPLFLLGKMKVENIVKGLGTLAATLAILGIAGIALSKFLAPMVALTGIIALTGLSMIVLGAGLTAIAAAFKITPAGEIATGLMKIGGALIVFTIGALLASVLSPLIMLLGSSLLTLGKGLIAVALAFAVVSSGEIATGLMKIGGALTVFTLAALPALLLSPLLLLLSSAMLMLGKGVLALSIGITALAAALSVGGSLIVSGLQNILITIIGLIPSLIEAIGTGIIKIADVVGNSGASITKAISAVIISAMKAIDESVPVILDTVFNLLDALLKKLVEFTPKFVVAGAEIIIGVLNGIASKLPDIIQAGANVVISFIEGITSTIPKLVDAGFKAMIDLINGLAESIRANTPILIDAMNNLLSACAEAAGMYVGNFLEVGKQLMAGFVKGIKDSVGSVVDAVVGGVKKAWNGALEFLGIHSPSKRAAEAGKFINEGLAVGLNKYSNLAEDAATDVAKETSNSLSDALSSIPNIMDAEAQPTIRPVVDLSDVKSGANEVNDLFGFSPSVGVLSNVNAIGSSMNNRQNGDNAVISAIKDLERKLSNGTNNVYNINGVTYDDGSSVAVAVESLIRAARIERRI